jgi:hypothetical protein
MTTTPPAPSFERNRWIVRGLSATAALWVLVLATIANSRKQQLLDTSAGTRGALPAALTDLLHSAFLAGAGIAVVSLIATIVVMRSPRRDFF